MNVNETRFRDFKNSFDKIFLKNLYYCDKLSHKSANLEIETTVKIFEFSESLLKVYKKTVERSDNVKKTTHIVGIVNHDLSTKEQLVDYHEVKDGKKLRKKITFSLDCNMFLCELYEDEKLISFENHEISLESLNDYISASSEAVLLRLYAFLSEKLYISGISFNENFKQEQIFFIPNGEQVKELNGETETCYSLLRKKISKDLADVRTIESFHSQSGQMVIEKNIDTNIELSMDRFPNKAQILEYIHCIKADQIEFDWKKDLQMLAKCHFLKETVISKANDYFSQNPIIEKIVIDYLSALICMKPENIIDFTKDYFIQYN